MTLSPLRFRLLMSYRLLLTRGSIEAHLGLTALLWGVVLVFPPDVIQTYHHLRMFLLTTESDLVWGWCSITLGLIQLLVTSTPSRAFIRRIVGSFMSSWWMFFLFVTWEAAPGIPSVGMMAALVISSALSTIAIKSDKMIERFEVMENHKRSMNGERNAS